MFSTDLAQQIHPKPCKSLNSLRKTQVFHNLTCFMVDHIFAPKHTKIDLEIDQQLLKTTSNNQSKNSLKTHFRTEIALKMEPKMTPKSIKIDPKHP